MVEMTFGEHGPQTRYDHVEETTQQLQSKKIIEYDTPSDEIEGKYGIAMPEGRDDQALTEIEIELAALKDGHESERLVYQQALQKFFDRIGSFSLEDIHASFAHLGKNQSGEGLTSAQISYLLNEPLSQLSGATAINHNNETTKDLSGEQYKKLRKSIDEVDFSTLSGEDATYVQEKLTAIQRSLPLGGVPGITRDQYAILVLLKTDDRVRDMDIFPTPEAKATTTTVIEETIEHNKEMQNLINMAQKEIQIFEKSVLEKKGSSTFLASQSLERPANARNVAEKLQTIPSSTTQKTINSVTETILGNIPVITTITDKMPVSYDESLAPKLMERYHISEEQKDVFMMGITLQQRSQNPNNALTTDQQIVVDKAMEIVHSATSDRIQEKLADETEALYLQWAGNIMGEVDADIPTYQDGILHADYRIPGYDDVLFVDFGNGKIRTTQYLPPTIEDSGNRSYAALTTTSLPLELPNMGDMVTDTLSTIAQSQDLTGMDDVDTACDDIVRQKREQYNITNTRKIFQSHVADIRAKFAMRDMMKMRTYRISSAEQQLPIEQHKQMGKMLNPSLQTMSIKEKEQFVASCRKRTQRARGADNIIHNAKINASDGVLKQHIKEGNLRDMMRAFVSSSGGKKPSLQVGDFQHFTQYIEGIKQGTIVPQETFVSYAEKKGIMLSSQLRKIIEDGEKKNEIAQMTNAHPYLQSWSIV